MKLLPSPLPRSRTYRTLFGAQVVALLGTGLLTVALSLLAFDVEPDGAGAVVATALTIKMLAYVAVAPLVAAAVWRFAPRTVLVGSNVVRCLIAATLPWVSEAWHVYVLIFVLQSASATFTPAFQAVIPRVLTDEAEYTRALSLSRLAYDLESVVSPAISAGLLLVTTFHGVFAGTAVGFAASTVLVWRAGLELRPPEKVLSFRTRVSSGLARFLITPSLRAVLALDVVVAATTAFVLVDTVVIVRQDFGLGETAVAVALGCYGTGSMIGALTVPALLRRVSDRTVMLAGAVLAPAALLAAAVATAGGGWGAVLGMWVALGTATSLMLTPVGRIVTATVDEWERPAVFAANFSLSHACFLVTYPLAGWSATTLGAPGSATLLCVVAGVGAAGARRLWRPSLVAAQSRTETAGLR